MHNPSKATYYKLFKTDIHFEEYLDNWKTRIGLYFVSSEPHFINKVLKLEDGVVLAEKIEFVVYVTKV